MSASKRLAWLDSSGFLVRPLPKDCVRECAAAGDVSRAVAYWRERLRFDVPREMATSWLAESGGWECEDLDITPADTLSERVLWMLACEARETGKMPAGCVL